MSFLLFATMLISVLCAAPFNVFAATTHNVSTVQELSDACDAINQSGGKHTISLTDDINGVVSIVITNSDAVVTVIGNGHTLTSTDSAVYVSNGATVNLGDGNSALTLTSNDNNDNPGIIYVLDNGVCNMYNNVTVCDHKGNNYFGGGVTVQSGTFNMRGGTIDNCGIEGGSVCYGGGVAVINGGIFTMDGGTISNCYATSDYIDYYDSSRCISAMGGGVFVTNGSTFTMDGGTITGCEATNFGGGVAIVSADSFAGNYSEYRVDGMGNIKSTATINSGTISSNEAGNGAGVFASGYFYSFAAPFGSYNSSGIGVTNHPGLYINGGEISSNTADDMGGGVLIAMLRASIKAQIHNAVIKDNNADSGAGIENFRYWTQMDIDGCTITGNEAVTNGGGVLASSNSSNGYTKIKDTVIEDNTSGARGAGVYYDGSSQLKISGKNIIKGNTFNGKKNNLNILSRSKPVYVIGDLTGSQIGLSDPTLWDDNMEDTDTNAVSTDYLTSGYKSNNASLDPLGAFFSDHESWYPDFSNINNNEVRLVRKTYDVNYHINNADKDDIYADEIFTPYITNHEVKDGKTIEEFHNIPQLKDPDGYVFKGWYYDRDNTNDNNPIVFGETYDSQDIYKGYHKNIDIYAHWEKVDKIEQEKALDEKDLPNEMKGDDGKYYYSSFGLFGVQLRPDRWIDENTTVRENGGLRFATSIGEELLRDIDELSTKKVVSEQGYEHNVEYGFVTASQYITDTIVNDPTFNINKATYKLQYKGTDVNGVNTTVKERSANNFNYVTNVDCTSTQKGYGGNPNITMDHRNCNKYRLATFVVTYDTPEDFEKNYQKEVIARAYMRYYDANGLLRTFYNDYGGTCVYGGCSISYDGAEKLFVDNDTAKR